MILLEVNEFSPDLMRLAAKELNASNLTRLLQMRCSNTTTDDKYERFGLDPWVQWVSIHTGRLSSEHGIKHLGDVPALEHPQLWETLSSMGISSGVWGAMNASKGSADKCKFFFPDPWSYSESAFPSDLNNLLDFPRYYSKNYTDLSFIKSFIGIFKAFSFCLRPSIFRAMLPIIPELVKNIYKYRFQEYLLFVLFDLVNASMFSAYYRKYKPEFAVLFLNSLAHLQHHKWTKKNELSEEMKITFLLFDKLLGIVFSVLEDNQPILVANAFSQYCSFDENEFLYRQKNPEKFLQCVNISFEKVEQAMTNDGHVFFNSVTEAINAVEILENAKIDDVPLFHVDYDASDELKVFFQVAVWKDLEENTILRINGKDIYFFDVFERITRRSGSHLQAGHVFSRGIDLPSDMYNHKIYDFVINHFNSKLRI